MKSPENGAGEGTRTLNHLFALGLLLTVLAARALARLFGHLGRFSMVAFTSVGDRLCAHAMTSAMTKESHRSHSGAESVVGVPGQAVTLGELLCAGAGAPSLTTVLGCRLMRWPGGRIV